MSIRPGNTANVDNVGIVPGTLWTGQVILELCGGADQSVGEAELSLHRELVWLRHDGRALAVIDRDLFRGWLIQTEPAPLVVDDVVCSVQVGITFLATGTALFRVSPESLAMLVSVI